VSFKIRTIFAMHKTAFQAIFSWMTFQLSVHNYDGLDQRFGSQGIGQKSMVIGHISVGNSVEYFFSHFLRQKSA
jgi:hypothetical protein